MGEPNAVFHIYHGGSFKRENQKIVYAKGLRSVVEVDRDLVSVGDIKEDVCRLGYDSSSIAALYYAIPNMPLLESLVCIQIDKNINDLVDLCSRYDHVKLYVEHVDNENEESFNIVVEDGYCNDVDAEFEYSEGEYGLNSDNEDDEDLTESREKKKKKKEEIVGLKKKCAIENEGEACIDSELNEVAYQDSDDADSPSSSSESEECEGSIRRKKKNIRYCRFKGSPYDDAVDLEVGMKFKDKKEVKAVVQNYKIVRGYSLKITTSDPGRLQYECRGGGCEWTLWVSKPQKEESWQIKSMPRAHKCIRYNFEDKDRKLSSEWLANKYKESWKLHPSMKVREFMNIIKKDCIYEATLSMALRAKNIALTQIIGDYKDQFAIVRDYCLEVLKKNIGSTAKVTTTTNPEGQHVFKCMYLCLESLKQGFLRGCRKVLCIDGCFIKGPWNGQILVVVGRDANDQMYPLAWGVAQRENNEVWKWFIELLQLDLEMGDGHDWTIISDQQKGLVEAIADLLPEAEHRLCARHVYANLRKQWRGVKYREVFWKLAKSSNMIHFDRFKKEMIDLDPAAWEFLEKKDPKHFCRVFFKSHAKCDSVDNNMAEIFNGNIIDARFKPIVTMLDDIYTSVMSRVAKRQGWAKSLDKPIPPRIFKKVQIGKNQARWWHATRAGSGFHSVRSLKDATEGFSVHLQSRTCSCKYWEMSGVPCRHAIAAMGEEKIEPTNYVHSCYSTEKLNLTYAHTLRPINGQDMWEKALGDQITAPVFQIRKRGGLRFKRRPEVGETRATRFGKVSKSGTSVHCSTCGKTGHNMKTCRQNLGMGVVGPSSGVAVARAAAPASAATAAVPTVGAATAPASAATAASPAVPAVGGATAGGATAAATTVGGATAFAATVAAPAGVATVAGAGTATPGGMPSTRPLQKLKIKRPKLNVTHSKSNTFVAAAHAMSGCGSNSSKAIAAKSQPIPTQQSQTNLTEKDFQVRVRLPKPSTSTVVHKKRKDNESGSSQPTKRSSSSK